MGAATGAIFDVGSQMLLEGRSWDCVDWESVKRSALEGAVMGAIGGAVGGVLHKAVQAGKIAKRVAWMIGAAYDVGAGTAWDMVAYGRSPSEAFARNLLTFGIGAAAGTLAGSVIRRVGSVARQVGSAARRVGSAIREFGQSLADSPAVQRAVLKAKQVATRAALAPLNLLMGIGGTSNIRLTGGGKSPIEIFGRTLFIAEGDYSFSLSIARQQSDNQRRLMTVTGFTNGLQPTNAEFANYLDNIMQLEQLGVRVGSGVSAFDLGAEFPNEVFDTIVANFPNTGRGLGADQQFLEGFFRSANDVLAQEGRVIVSHSTNPHYRRWGITRRAEEYFLNASSEIFSSFEEYGSFFPGYGHVRTSPGSPMPDIPGVQVWTFKR